jgi:hypothetical protein
MGWAEDEFLDNLAYEREIPGLWDRVRESVALAVQEFNARVLGTAHSPVDLSDCSAEPLCCRLHKDNSKLVVRLNEDQRLLTTSSNGAPGKTICHFRLAPGRSALELFLKENDVTTPISIDEGCKRAIREFVFTPFPAGFRKDPDPRSPLPTVV